MFIKEIRFIPNPESLGDYVWFQFRMVRGYNEVYRYSKGLTLPNTPLGMEAFAFPYILLLEPNVEADVVEITTEGIDFPNEELHFVNSEVYSWPIPVSPTTKQYLIELPVEVIPEEPPEEPPPEYIPPEEEPKKYPNLWIFGALIIGLVAISKPWKERKRRR